jgi:hypothetical protein
LDIADLFGYDEFPEMFRHTGLEYFGVTLLEENYKVDMTRVVLSLKGIVFSKIFTVISISTPQNSAT